MNDITECLYKNLPHDVYNHVYQQVVKGMFDECDIINGYMDLHEIIDETVALTDLIGIQLGNLVRFNDENNFNRNVMHLSDDNEFVNDVVELINKGILRFKHLKIYNGTKFTSILINQAEFVHWVSSYRTVPKKNQRENIDLLEVRGSSMTAEELVEVIGDENSINVLIKNQIHKVTPSHVPFDIIKAFQNKENVYIDFTRDFLLDMYGVFIIDEWIADFKLLQNYVNRRLRVIAHPIIYITDSTTDGHIQIYIDAIKRIGLENIEHLTIAGELTYEWSIDFSFVEKMINLKKLNVEIPILVSLNTFGDLRNTKLNKAKFTTDQVDHDWIPNYLPSTLHALTIFKSNGSRTRFQPIIIPPNVKFLTILHDESYYVSLDPKYIDFRNSTCQITIMNEDDM